MGLVLGEFELGHTWSLDVLSGGTGTIADDPSTAYRGERSLKIVNPVQVGTPGQVGVSKDYVSNLDLSGVDAFSFWIKPADQGTIDEITGKNGGAPDFLGAVEIVARDAVLPVPPFVRLFSFQGYLTGPFVPGRWGLGVVRQSAFSSVGSPSWSSIQRLVWNIRRPTLSLMTLNFDQLVGGTEEDIVVELIDAEVLQRLNAIGTPSYRTDPKCVRKVRVRPDTYDDRPSLYVIRDRISSISTPEVVWSNFRRRAVYSIICVADDPDDMTDLIRDVSQAIETQESITGVIVPEPPIVSEFSNLRDTTEEIKRGVEVWIGTAEIDYDSPHGAV